MSENVAAGLKPCTSVRVTVLIDNVSDILSTTPEGIIPHVGNLIRKKPAWALTGECLCCANWGLSLGIEITHEGGRTRLLFDAGPDRANLRRNARLLGYDLCNHHSVVLSHGHWDHAGGLLESFAQRAKGGATGGHRCEFHGNSDMFVRRGMRMPSGSILPFKDPPSPRKLENAGALLNLDGGERLIGGGFAYFSGQVPRTTSYEVGLPGHVRWNRKSRTWEDDPLILDERWLAVNLAGKGILLFSSCSHAGIVNVLHHAAAVFGDIPIHGVMGGLHLSGPANEAIIEPTVRDMQAFGLKRIVPGHCTGWRAVSALAEAFGDGITPLSVGQTHVF